MTQFSLIMIFVIVVLLAAGAGGIAAIFHFRVKRSKKEIETIEGTPLTGAGRLQSGLHKASGTSVALDKPVVSPLTQTECVFYHFRIEELRTSQRDTRKMPTSVKLQPVQSSWHTVVSDKQAVPCGLQDETGMARVDLLGAEMVLTSSKPKESSLFDSCPPELQETLKRRYDFSTKGLLLSKSLRYTEMIIRPGDKLFVLGDVETKDGEPPTFVKREHSFIVSDKDEAEVTRHFRRCIVGGYVVMGIIAVVTVLFASMPIYVLASLPPAKQPVAANNKPQPAAAAPEKKQPVQQGDRARRGK